MELGRIRLFRLRRTAIFGAAFLLSNILRASDVPSSPILPLDSDLAAPVTQNPQRVIRVDTRLSQQGNPGFQEVPFDKIDFSRGAVFVEYKAYSESAPEAKGVIGDAHLKMWNDLYQAAQKAGWTLGSSPIVNSGDFTYDDGIGYYQLIKYPFTQNNTPTNHGGAQPN